MDNLRRKIIALLYLGTLKTKLMLTDTEKNIIALMKIKKSLIRPKGKW